MIVDENLHALSIIDDIIRALRGRIVNVVEYPRYAIGKELQCHVVELKGRKPFHTPEDFEETIQEAVLTLAEFLRSKFQASLLGTGMHPFIRPSEAKIWCHRHRSIYEIYERIFNVRQHGWLNIQAFQLNLPYGGRRLAASFHNALAGMLPYLPAIAASSPIYEGKFGTYVDNRMHFYKINQIEVPSLVGDVIPDYTDSLEAYREKVIGRYSSDLARAGATKPILNVDWVNSRGITFRYDRHAIEIRILDEQECVKSDVAVSCYIRAALRGLLSDKEESHLLSHELLVKDLNSVIKEGLSAKVQHPQGPTARSVCEHLYRLACKYALDEEKPYLPLIRRRIDEGNLSEIISREVKARTQKTDMHEAIVGVYTNLVRSLTDNTPYF
jgi:gamma-glutamyl:cysteine ligase YbdK (ATP-grasp superfamily)